jgi:HEAT repeat protein
MTPAGAERLARRLHRYDLDESGGPLVEHLARVAALVRAAGGTPDQLMAAWLHRLPRTEVQPENLAARGIPPAVLGITEAIGRRHPGEPLERRAARIRSCPDAPLVLLAVINDRYRLGADVGKPPARGDALLLAQAGIPRPAVLATEPDPDPATLLDRLNPGDPNRWEAARLLAEAYEPAAIRPLFDALLAAQAGDAGWADGPPGTAGKEYLSRVLTKIVLHRQWDEPALAPVFLAMAGHCDYRLRQDGIRCLAAFPEHRPVIEQALGDESPVVVAAAVRALPAERVPALTDRLLAVAGSTETGWLWARLAAMQALYAAGDPRGRALILAALAVHGKVPVYNRRHRVSAMGRHLIADEDPSVVPALIAHLRNPRARIVAARLLGDKRAREATGDLVAALATAVADESPEMMLACIIALGKIRDPAAIPALGEACGHAVWFIRETALQALFWSDDSRVTEVALAAAEDFNPKVRDRAVRLLAARGDGRAVSRLLSACDGPLAPAALRGLIRLGDERAVPVLINVLAAATDRRTMRLAARAIVSSARTPAGDRLIYGRRWPLAHLREVVWILGELGEAQYLRPNYLKHRDEMIRVRTVTALGKDGSRSYGGDLAAALTDISPGVRASAAIALASTVNRPAPARRRSISNPAPVTADEARVFLEPLRTDPHPSVRAAAAAALGRLG